MWNGVVTNAGLALLERWSEGSQTLNIEKATIGTGTVPQSNLRVSTTVVGEVGPVSIVSSAAVTNGTSYRVQVGPSSTVPYIGHQIGIWASLEGVGVTTLLAIYQDEEGVSIPLSADAPGFLFTLYAIVTMSNEGSINVNYDGGAYVSRTDFADTMTVVNNNITTLQNKFPVSIANGGTGATTGPNACKNLGAVKKSGDIMTGNLEFDSGLNYTGVEFKGAAGSPSVFIRNTGSRMIFDQFANGSTGGERYLLPSVESRSADAWYDIITTKPGNYQFNRLVPNIDLTSMPSSEQVSYAINFMDKNKTAFGYVSSRQETDGRVDVGFGVARTIGGTMYFNSVFTGVKPDGTKVVSLSDKQAWIAGLGLAYAPSDTYAEPASVVCGIVRNSGKQFVLRVSLQKTMENINTVSVTQLTGFMAGMNGIIGGSGATTNWLTMSGVTVRGAKRSNNTALIIVESTSVLTNAATGVLSFFGDFTLAFS